MKFIAEIELGNDAMQSRDDVLDSIRLALTRQSDYASMKAPLEPGDEATLNDGNGNTVGKWEVVV